jgi:mono/diheme cytochrome c family protein
MTNLQRQTTKNTTPAPLHPCTPAWLWLLLILLTSSMFLWPVTAQAAPPAQTPDEMPSVIGGRTGWSETCLPCHGPTGQGDGPTAETIEGPLPDFSDPETARRRVPVENFETIKNGRLEKLMPPWGDRLNDAQIWDKVAYIWSLGTTFENMSAGNEIYLDQCAACHGDNGAGNGPAASVEMMAFTDLEAMVQHSQADLYTNYEVSEQHAALDNLSDDELWQTLDFIRTFSFKVPERNGFISGQVVNATTNQPAANVEVRLHAFQDDTEVFTLAGRADETGHYSFEKVPNDHTLVYLIEGFYQDVAYVGDEPGIFTPAGTPETNIDVKVYNTTSVDETISITQLHYLLSFSPGAVNVVQVFVVGNSGNQTYIGRAGQTFRFELPAGATNVAFQNNPNQARFMPTETGYADTEPVMPGEDGQTIAALYDIPYSRDSLAVEVPLPAAVVEVNVLVIDQGVELKSGQVEFVETRQFQGNTFEVYRGDSLGQDDTLTFNLAGLNNLDFINSANIPDREVALNSTGLNQDVLRWIMLGLGGVVIVLAGVIYPLTRPQQATSPVDLSEANLETHRRKLLLTLARLDQIFEAGELDEKNYRRARARYKAELVQIMEMTD